MDAIVARTSCLTHVSEPTIGVLFSGGVDCALIARALDLVLPTYDPIELINVAFEAVDAEGDFDVPDRRSAISCLSELQQLSPTRQFIFNPVDVSLRQSQQVKAEVRALMYPNDTVMDESIAIAFYFCAKHARSKVLFSGLGADEQFGGYVRHHRAFQRSGWEGLAAELAQDKKRLPSRNLGRDDRIISHFGKEVRYPYLDEPFMSATNSLPLNVRMSGGPPGKELLRDVCFGQGLVDTFDLPKRAIQFGSRSSRINKHLGSRPKGHVTLSN